ncbi:hypothetical protein A6U87_11895 [Rhizobium sp. AC44/96]|uniref:aminoglycoside phosphotransferase family protein n=1 Tax=Rhizobium sp. AC44/96 TaxID=1841654 RepID=UPI00080FFB38|nr:phosphotransferase [Rhizobium sp. AC44/96]OCJ07955.1 hypothetical protein A6U87_11895 [Rhizobium sp. AC44/96]
MSIMQDQTSWDARQGFVFKSCDELLQLTQLPADASPRKYYRVEFTPRLLMEVPAHAPDFPAFVEISRHLVQLGLSAPQVYAMDLDRGLALIEDFGHDTFTRLFARGESETELYQLAIDTLVHLHDAPGATRIDLPSYDETPLFEELGMFTDWFAPFCNPDLDIARFKQRFLSLWKQTLAEVAGRREVLVLRDYHVDNLMVIDGREGIAACGVLDFQDALIGSATYDLVSLTQDARRSIAPALETSLVERYLAARPNVDHATFMADYWLLAAHRHTKILGNFERLSRRDGKHGYLRYQEHVSTLLDRALSQANLTEIRSCMDECLPGWQQFAQARSSQPADLHERRN